MRSVIVALGVLLLFMSCKGIKGEFVVNQPITLKTQSGRFSFAPANYSAELEVASANKLYLKSAGKTFRFDLPKETEIPSENGTFSVAREDLGQPYDLEGLVATKVEIGALIETDIHCTYEIPIHQCRPTRYGGMHCWTEWVSQPGMSHVRYSDVTEDKRIELALLEGSEVKASFAGNEVKEYREYEYRGPCL